MENSALATNACRVLPWITYGPPSSHIYSTGDSFQEFAAPFGAQPPDGTVEHHRRCVSPKIEVFFREHNGYNYLIFRKRVQPLILMDFLGGLGL